MRKARMIQVVTAVVFGTSIFLSGCGGGGVGITKEQWWTKFKQNNLDQKIGYNCTPGTCNKQEFTKIMGSPNKTQTVEDKTYWYYNCRDGKIQMILSRHWLEEDNRVMLDPMDGINKY